MKRNLIVLLAITLTLLFGCSESDSKKENKVVESKSVQTEQVEAETKVEQTVETDIIENKGLNLGITPEEFIYLYNYELTYSEIDANLLLNQDMLNEYTQATVETDTDGKVVRIDFISHTFNPHIFSKHLVRAISPQIPDEDIPDMMRFYLGFYGDQRDIEPNKEFSGSFIVDNVKYEISTIDASKRKHKMTISTVEEN